MISLLNIEFSFLVEDLISLIETIAQSLTQGDVSVDLFNRMFSSLSLHGTQLEIYSKEILDRCFIIFRNASQDDRLKISIRLNLLNLIELRANSWILSDGLNSYYKQKAATNVEVRRKLALIKTVPMKLNDLRLVMTREHLLWWAWECLSAYLSRLVNSWKTQGSSQSRRKFLAKATRKMKSLFETLTAVKVSGNCAIIFAVKEIVKSFNIEF